MHLVYPAGTAISSTGKVPFMGNSQTSGAVVEQRFSENTWPSARCDMKKSDGDNTCIYMFQIYQKYVHIYLLKTNISVHSVWVENIYHHKPPTIIYYVYLLIAVCIVPLVVNAYISSVARTQSFWNGCWSPKNWQFVWMAFGAKSMHIFIELNLPII